MEALRDHICQLGLPTPVQAPVRGLTPPQTTTAQSEQPLARPISFNDEMIRALLTGRKNQTRRLANGSTERCPFGGPGDLLWVRERWSPAGRSSAYRYAADADAADEVVRFRPTFHMPRAACRIMLRITAVQLQSLQSITARDARGEGYDPAVTDRSPRAWFANLWDRIFTAAGSKWEDNPRVWVVRFEVLRRAASLDPLQGSRTSAVVWVAANNVSSA